MVLVNPKLIWKIYVKNGGWLTIRKGELSKAISLAQIKNPLEEIGNNDKETESKESTPAMASNNPFESDIDDDTLKHSTNVYKIIRMTAM